MGEYKEINDGISGVGWRDSIPQVGSKNKKIIINKSKSEIWKFEIMLAGEQIWQGKPFCLVESY